MATQVEIARRLGLDVSSVNKILNRCRGPVFRKETIRKVFETARELGYDFGRIKFRHRRRHPRRPVRMNAEVSILNDDGTLHDQGLARIENISAGGALLKDLALPMGTLPVEPFTVQVRPLRRPLQALGLEGRIVRLTRENGQGFGVHFQNLDEEALGRLRQIAAN